MKVAFCPDFLVLSLVYQSGRIRLKDIVKKQPVGITIFFLYLPSKGIENLLIYREKCLSLITFLCCPCPRCSRAYHQSSSKEHRKASPCDASASYISVYDRSKHLLFPSLAPQRSQASLDFGSLLRVTAENSLCGFPRYRGIRQGPVQARDRQESLPLPWICFAHPRLRERFLTSPHTGTLAHCFA